MSIKKPAMLGAPLDLSVLGTLVEGFVDGVWDGNRSEKELDEIHAAIGLAAIEAFYGETIAPKLAARAMERLKVTLKEFT